MCDQSLCQSKTDEYFQGGFRSFEIRKAATGFYNTNNEKQHQ